MHSVLVLIVVSPGLSLHLGSRLQLRVRIKILRTASFQDIVCVNLVFIFMQCFPDNVLSWLFSTFKWKHSTYVQINFTGNKKSYQTVSVLVSASGVHCLEGSETRDIGLKGRNPKWWWTQKWGKMRKTVPSLRGKTALLVALQAGAKRGKSINTDTQASLEAERGPDVKEQQTNKKISKKRKRRKTM